MTMTCRQWDQATFIWTFLRLRTPLTWKHQLCFHPLQTLLRPTATWNVLSLRPCKTWKLQHHQAKKTLLPAAGPHLPAHRCCRSSATKELMVPHPARKPWALSTTDLSSSSSVPSAWTTCVRALPSWELVPTATLCALAALSKSSSLK